MQDTKELLDHYNSIVNKIADEIYFFTPQLFKVKDHISRLPASPHSTAILVKIKLNYFLITAGHSIHNENLLHIGFYVEKDFCAIGGMLACVDHNNEDDFNPSKLDLAIFLLDEITVSRIEERYKFLDFEKLMFKHLSSPMSHYLLFGYPETLTSKHFPTKTINPSSFRLRSVGVPIRYYLFQNVNPSEKLILYLDHKNIRGKDSSIQDRLQEELGGISGCGIWEISDIDSLNPKYHLVSIVTGEDEHKKVLYSTKIDVIPAIIKSYFNIDLRI